MEASLAKLCCSTSDDDLCLSLKIKKKPNSRQAPMSSKKKDETESKAKSDENQANDSGQKDPATASLDALFKLKQTKRQVAVDLIMKTILKIINKPTNKKLQDLNFDTVNDKIGKCGPGLALLYSIGFATYTTEDNKTRIKIDIKGSNDPKLQQLKQIYDIMYYRNSERGLVHREEFNCKKLMTEFPPKFKDGRKKAVFKLIVPNGADDCSGTLVYSRHQLIELPAVIPDPTDFIQNRMKIEPNIFEYISNAEDPSKAHFYVNFADANLFGFYRGSLFAQDEIMSLEHPILAALREKLVDASEGPDSKLMPYCRGSVVILNALKHGHFTQKSLDKIYGGKFGRSSVDKIKKSVDKCEPVISDNIVCIASLMGMVSKYKKQEIEKLLKTAYCGYNGAVCETLAQQVRTGKANDEGNDEEKKMDNDDKSILDKRKVIIHTGNWGCGAFGGNIAVHTMLQVVAAVGAGVDYMYYHSVDKKSMKKAQEGCEILLKELYPKCKDKKGGLKVSKFVDELLKKGFKWGTPNGT